MILFAAGLLALSACGGEDDPASAAPDGFKTLTGSDWTLAYPAGWSVTEVNGSRLAQGPKGTGGLAPQTAVARDVKPPPFDVSIDAFKSDQTLRRGNWTITRDAEYKLAGADRARVIEADYIERTGAGTTPVKTIDLLVRTKDNDQLDFLMRAPQADFDRVRLNEVLDTIRLK
jgi:hypothetical protein